MSTPALSTRLALATALLVAAFAPPVCTQAGTVTRTHEIAEGRGGFGGSLGTTAAFGSSVAVIGDVDGDGIDDLAVGAGGDLDIFNSAFGSVWILFLDADASVRSEVRIGQGSGGFGGTLAVSDNFGCAVTPLGDLDGNGVPDLAVGAESTNGPTGLVADGAVWTVFLESDGTVANEVLLGSGAGGLGTFLGFFDQFGASLANVGDLDGDGTTDLAVGRLGDANDEGSVVILFLNPDGTVRTWQEISSSCGGLGVQLDPLDYFGSAVCSLGDLDGDGVQDIAVGAWGDDDGEDEAGAVYVLFLQPDGFVRDRVKLSSEVGGLGVTLAGSARFGSSLATLPDLDGDGLVEIAVGAQGPQTGATTPGSLWIVDLSSSGTANGALEITTGRAGFDTPVPGGALFGRSSGFLGDLDADGNPELAVGALRIETDGTTSEAGQVFLLSLCDSDLVADFDATPTGGAKPLDVAFQDLTSGAGAWGTAWDFGDGSSSSDTNPTHTYPQAGTYTVRLVVSGTDGACGATQADRIQVEAGPASATERNGSGTNPDLLDAINLPALGTTWSATVDAGRVSASGLTSLVAYDRSLPGLPTALGELLVDPRSTFVAVDTAPIVGPKSQHDVAIPSDLALDGFAVFTQAFVLGTNQLTNALDLILGK